LLATVNIVLRVLGTYMAAVALCKVPGVLEAFFDSCRFQVAVQYPVDLLIVADMPSRLHCLEPRIPPTTVTVGAAETSLVQREIRDATEGGERSVSWNQTLMAASERNGLEGVTF